MVRDQVLVVTEKGESETDAGIVIAASVSYCLSLHAGCDVISLLRLVLVGGAQGDRM